MTSKIQQTNKVEETSVMKGRTSLKYVLHLKDCSREVGEHLVFHYEGEFFPAQIVSITKGGVNIIALHQTLKSWKWSNQIRCDGVSLGGCGRAYWQSKTCLQKRILCCF
ncbi:hypothetical protein AVEN_136664-1 [Araneus ventricosus]|uniref:Uncharacterized protein n=1 Tax=Araneus ventricosus TaxID=182803 RepID=A0A4Y2SPU4_ARAVE|nr:hypothetical protein AVEN_136664-1 [Araneus ventricosus]